MLRARAKILSNKQVKGDYFHLTLSGPAIAKEAKPGQFVNVRINDSYEPLLRRPFSIHRIGSRPNTEHRTPNTIEVLYEVVGKGTRVLSEKGPGECLDIIGPLGNGFDYKSPGHQVTRSPVLVAGGMGVAPLLFLADRLAYSVERIAYRENLSAIRYPLNAIVLIGAKTKSHIICADEFKDLGCEVKIATDDGSRGFKGRVTDLLKDILRASSIEYRASSIYSCGPQPMLKEISRISRQYNIPAQISLEEHMACGIGACLGCAVNTKEGYKRVCKEGPVFNTSEIIWQS